jgi:hypothetical protein
MGTDISGWVEYWDPNAERWVGVIKLVPLVSDRSYELFAWLFGVGRRPDIPMRWQDPPIAAGRGLPPDASDEVAAEHAADLAQFPEEFYGVTWVTWREVQTIDWDEPIEDMIVESRVDRPGGIYHWCSQFVQHHPDLLPDQAESLQPGQRWTSGDRRYKVVAMRRRDVLEEPWKLLFRLMEVLASQVENTNHLRWVVWFDG